MGEEEGQDRAIGHAIQRKATKIDGNHKGIDVRKRTGINIIERNNAPTSSQASSRATSTTTSRATSPSPMRKISRRERVDENLQDISARIQQTGQVLTAATSALFKNMKPDKKYR
jgi:hypothetical protein